MTVEQGASGSVRLRLDVSYDGSGFSGWAAQPGRRTVAGVVTDVFGQLFGRGVATGLTVAGRTDAGVHAAGQVCHIDLPATAWQALGARAGGTGDAGQSLLRRLAGLLPPDVRVRAVTQVPGDFDARFSATYRRYEYRVTDAPWGAEPLRRHEVLAWPRPVDLPTLRVAAAELVGEHDFAAYCRRREHATTRREITRLDWRRDDTGLLVATVQADAFCHSMVRSLIGAMLAAGDGRRPPTWPASLLTLRERSSEVTVAPPHGLCLVAVGYPDDPAEYGRRAAATRRLRV
ncbi:MAG TPA: tRNA pseudouridine(38-40) synthase TruA [Micromonosporaceae bacterium]